MGIFKGRIGRLERTIDVSSDELAAVGRAAFGGEELHPQGLQWPGLDPYAITVYERAGYPPVVGAAADEFFGRFLEDLAGSVDPSVGWASVGAMLIAANVLPSDQYGHPRFLALLDAALRSLRADGIAYSVLPPFMVGYWTSRYGYDGVHPSGWPSSLDVLTVPQAGEEPSVIELAEGESRTLSIDSPEPDARKFGAERRGARVVATVTGVDTSDGLVKHWDLHVEAPSYLPFLREFGEYLVTPRWWTHGDLLPYIPCRARTRQQMREAVAAAAWDPASPAST
jgi:hypothetical protein